MGSVAKSYMRKGFLIYEKMRKYFTIYGEAVSHIWLCTRSFWISLYTRKILFYFLSVYSYSYIPPREQQGLISCLSALIYILHCYYYSSSTSSTLLLQPTFYFFLSSSTATLFYLMFTFTDILLLFIHFFYSYSPSTYLLSFSCVSSTSSALLL